MFKFIIGLIVGILVIIFMVQNVEIVDIKLYAWTISIPRAIMILIVFVVGIILGWIIRSIGYRKKRKKEQADEEKEEIEKK